MIRSLPLLLLAACTSALPEIEATDDYGRAWRASRDQFRKTNLIIHDAMLAFAADSLEALIDVEMRLADEVKQSVLEPSLLGEAHGKAAVELRPDGAAGHLYYGVNIGMGALAKGPTRSLFEGVPTRLKEAYEKTIELDPSFDAGGGYRLKAKFLMGAPWPLRDVKSAEEALRKACAVADIAANHLYLGDALYLSDRPDEARIEWRRALTAPSHPVTDPVDRQLRELTRRRLRLLDG